MARTQELEKDFTRLHREGALSHGYLFFGGSFGLDDERLHFAKQLVGFLEAGNFHELPAPSDAMYLSGDTAGIDDIRVAVQFLWKAPAGSPRRVLVVSEAELLNTYAMNALLKVAEEPPKHGLLIIIARDPDSLLPALSSRLQRIFFSPSRSGDRPLPATTLDFLKSDRAGRSEIIKTLLDDETALTEFMFGIIRHFSSNIRKSHETLRVILRTLSVIREWNVNKRLQLESALLFV